MSKALFITIEGPDGSGKSTQIAKLKETLEKSGKEVVLTREPGGTAISEKIRHIILDRDNKEMCAMTEALLYAASRAQHVEQLIKPALAAGKPVICDRFVDSSIAYQGYGRGLGDAVRTINEYAVAGCMPDVTFLLYIDPERSKNRIRAEKLDRLDLEELHFHKEVYRGYMELLKQYPERMIAINADRSIEEVAEEIQNHLKRLLK